MSEMRRCTNCQDEIGQARVIFEGLRYCRACATELFAPASCALCGGNVLWPRDRRDPPQCARCRTVTCLRCNKAVPQSLAVLHAAGYSCKGCAPYLRPPRPCSQCQELHHRLARSTRGGATEPVCPTCLRTLEGHATCPACGKNRRLDGTDSAGRRVCAGCLQREGEPFVCPRCNRVGQPHSRTECVACYRRRRTLETARAEAARLGLRWSRPLLETCFRQLLAEKRDPEYLALRVPRYAQTCQELETRFADPGAITTATLLDHFGADGLRRNAALAATLARSYNVRLPTVEERRAHSESRRQQQLLAAAEGQWYAPLLRNYHASRQKAARIYALRGWRGRHARLRPRTVTASMRSAARLLEHLDPAVYAPLPARDSIRQLGQGQVLAFAAAHPGYRAGIGHFLGYVNREIRSFQRLKPVCPPSALRPELFIAHDRAVQLLRDWLAAAPGDARHALIGLLMLAIGLRPEQLSQIKTRDLIPDGNGAYLLQTGLQNLPLPPEITPILEAHLRRRLAPAPYDDATTNPYLFPGRNTGHALRPESVTYALRRQGLHADQLFATALISLYRAGLDLPRALIDALGIAIPTAIRYYEASARPLAWQLAYFSTEDDTTP